MQEEEKIEVAEVVEETPAEEPKEESPNGDEPKPEVA
jgi:hypothetical protein